MSRDSTGPNWSSNVSMGSSKVTDSFPIRIRTLIRYDSCIEGEKGGESAE
jgi:hypothetical protein